MKQGLLLYETRCFAASRTQFGRICQRQQSVSGRECLLRRHLSERSFSLQRKLYFCALPLLEPLLLPRRGR